MLILMAQTRDLAARALIDSAAPPVQSASVENKPVPPTPAVKPAAPVQPSGGIGRKLLKLKFALKRFGTRALEGHGGRSDRAGGIDKNKVS
ncbi:MAG: hypothetical protein R3D66_07155 [Alphaproteobacteria bacterium]